MTVFKNKPPRKPTRGQVLRRMGLIALDSVLYCLPWLGLIVLCLLALALALAFLLGNYALQYGATRLAAGTTALVMLSEVVFASVSSALLTAAPLEPRTLLGGSLIMLAALLAALQYRRSASA